MKKILVILVSMICAFGISGCSYLPVCSPNTPNQTNNSTEISQESNQDNSSETKNKQNESTNLWNSTGEVISNGNVTH